MEKTIINANKGGFNLNIREIIQYKDLLFTLAMRDFKVKYAGVFWAFLQPALTVTIFSFVFSNAVKIDTGNVPYALFALSGMIAWSYFSYVISQAGSSIIGAQGMIKKIYFPRLIIPLAKALVGLIDLGVVLLLLFGLLIYFGYPPSFNIIYFPLLLLFAIIAGLGSGIWLSALSVRYRDFQRIIPFIVQIGLYVTPVAYPSSLVPEKYQLLYHLNPAAGLVEGFRWSILGYGQFNEYSILSFVVASLIFITSLIYFKKVEKIMADIV
jgi:lipopolysaccharide transport system permease protein